MGLKEGSNIEQRIFDRIPIYPQEVTLTAIFAAFPFYAKTSIRYALKRLRAKGYLEIPPGKHFVIRRRESVPRPTDCRGGANRGQGRKLITQ